MSRRKDQSPPDRAPVARHQTIRGAIADALRGDELTAKELSARVSVREREVAEHLEHIEASLRHAGKHLRVVQPSCLSCGFVFDGRARFSKPSRCPSCKRSRIAPARFSYPSD